MAVYAKGNATSPQVALVLPGRLDTKDYPHMRSHVDYLASKGYYALSFDPPGTWESPGNLSLYTVTNYQKAIHELIEYLGNKPTILLGHSRGGGMAMLVGTHNPAVTHIITVFSKAGPSKVNTPAKVGASVTEHRDTPPNDREHQRTFELPYSFFADAVQYSMLEDLKTCLKPKLYFLGLQDKLAPPDVIQEIYDASANPKQLYELDSEHDYRYHQDLVDEVNTVVGRFLKIPGTNT